jgi:DNA-binding response OmpR family regulator
MNKPRILLVEDDPNLGYVLQDNLGIRGYEIYLCKDGDSALQVFQKENFDLCLLDVMLPKQDGFTLGKRIRELNQQIPILFLTAKSMTEDKLEGFRLGGDDYITKPFNIEELVMRIEVFLKRSLINNPEEEKTFRIGEYLFEHGNLRLAHLHHGSKILTVKESEVLKLLFLNRDRVMKREEILTKVWGDDDYFMGRSMDVFISRLRKYLKDDPKIEIVNYHGVGFKLEVGKG